MAFSEIKFHFLPLHCMRIYSINNLMYASEKALTFCRSGKKRKKKMFWHMQSDPFMFLTFFDANLALISGGFRELFNEMMVFQFKGDYVSKKFYTFFSTMLTCSISLLRSDAFNSSFESYSKILGMFPCQKMMMLCVFLRCTVYFMGKHGNMCVFWPRLCLATAAEKQNVG